MSWKSNLNQKVADYLVIPANEVIVDMNPNTQLSGGVAPVSLKKRKGLIFRNVYTNYNDIWLHLIFLGVIVTV